jgi:predicted SAM-dependent methyltransferase
MLLVSPPDKLPDGPRLNLGCGPVQPAGWINIDGSHRARFAHFLAPLDRLLVKLGILSPTAFGRHTQIANLFKPLPFARGSVRAIYAGEVWEHFTYDDALRLTRDCHRVLQPGGVLRVCVPDGQIFWRHYLRLVEAGDVPALRAHVDLYFREICVRPTLGSYGHFHKWQFDEPQLVDLFRTAGFRDVARRPYHESRIPDIAAVERSAFLIVEGVK